MTTVTGYTSQKMDEINNSTVVSGHVSGDNLVLMTRGGTPINAGHVRGPEGRGSAPIGVVFDYAGPDLPYGYLFCDGTPLPEDEAYDPLRALIGPNTPDLRDRFILSSGSRDPGEVGGAAAVALTVAQMPSHAHTAGSGTESSDHTHSGTSSQQRQDHAHHTATSGRNAAHTHPQFVVAGNGPTPNTRWDYQGEGPTGNVLPQGVHTETESVDHAHSGWSGGINVGHDHTLTTGGRSVAHTHTITVNAQGGGAAHENMPPFYVLTKIIKAFN